MSQVTVDELSHLSGVPVDVLRQGMASGLFAGLHRKRHGELYFTPEAIGLAAESARLGVEVRAGWIAPQDAVELLWDRAAQIRHLKKSTP